MKKLIFLLLTIVFIPALSFANGGDQRVVENKYLINLSRAPFTPKVNIKTSFLASFVDLQKNKLITEDIIVRIRIAKLGGGNEKREFIFEKDNVKVQGGITDFKYTFEDDGLHEIFFDFVFASNPKTRYEAPDFLIDIQKQENSTLITIKNIWIIGFGAAIAGVVIGLLLNKIKLRK